MIPITFYLYLGINYVLTTVYRTDSGYDKVRIGTSSLSTAAALCTIRYQLLYITYPTFCALIVCAFVILYLSVCASRAVLSSTLPLCFLRYSSSASAASRLFLAAASWSGVRPPSSHLMMKTGFLLERSATTRICGCSPSPTSPALSRTRRRLHLRRRIFPARI